MFGTLRRINRLRFVKKIGFSLHINPHMIKKLLIFDTSGGLQATLSGLSEAKAA
jgi:hypothetical protein